MDVVTTWHIDVTDGCEYFVVAAGGRSSNLCALVAGHPDIEKMLRDEVAHMQKPLAGH